MDRLQRLEMLADLWGKVYLFHPQLVTKEIDWADVLIDVIPKVEQAKSTDEVVAVLNDVMFKSLSEHRHQARRRSQTHHRGDC